MPVVALDATPLLGARTGIGVAVSGMLRELASRPEADRDLDLVGYGFTAKAWRRLPALLPAGVRASRGPMPANGLLRVWANVDQPTIEWWTGHLDVVHGTNFVVPPTRRASRLVSVWDMTAVRYPELCTPTSRRYPGLIRRAVSSGASVHTGSHYVAAEIAEHFGVAADRIAVVPPGVEARGPGRSPALSAGRAATGPPYVLGLGTTEPRKDLPGLVAAFQQVALAVPDLELRIAGPAGWAEDELQDAIRRSSVPTRIRRLGWVADAGALVAGATVFAYPSLYEGFGLPPLEAMAAGVPVVATTAGALPEVLGEAAALVPPGDHDALAASIQRAVEDTGWRDELIQRGRRRAAAFSWAAAGDGLVALYRSLVPSRS